MCPRKAEEGTNPDALEHVDNVVDPVPLHAEALGRFVQPDGLHVVTVVANHEARSSTENSVRTAEIDNNSRDCDETPNALRLRGAHLEQRRPSDLSLRL